MVYCIIVLSLISAIYGSPTRQQQSSSDIHSKDLSSHEERGLADLGISRIRRRSLEKRGVRIAFKQAVAFAPATPDIVTDNVLQLEPVSGTPLSQKYLQLIEDDRIYKDEKEPAKNAEVIQNIRDTVYLTTMKFGPEEFKLVIDTGSADTWLVQTGFKCISMLTRQSVASATCRFSRTYNNTKTFKAVANQHFNISYADGEFLNGEMGREDVTFGGITVPNQEFGLINYAAWNGDTISSGLTGLAFPSVTRAYPGADAKGDKRGGNVPYDPIFTSMWKKKLISPYFSIALNRASEGPGAVALGGLPGGSIKFEDKWAKAPMQHLMMALPGAKTPADYQLYVVETEGWSITSPAGVSAPAVNSTKVKVVLDTGTTLSYLPPAVANAINAAFDPPASQDLLMRQFIVNCNAKAPKVAMKLGGQMVWFDGEDLKLRTGAGNTCMSGIQASRSALQPSILGGVFLKNVVAVFDIGAAEMRFANRIR
ncbi:acid protease [Microthyrium microscopicum]|uniref:Acid protease n=1 Tax=Microthyrium microscopicum TaxID=703497 RepID=A0A6A6U896_9PEZI|nr:acid protease [Microthyrium microscopicum]